jgi:hypothetical protein
METEKAQHAPDDMPIVIYNLIALCIYTVVCKLTRGLFLLDAFFIVVHVVVCLIRWDSKRKRVWQLSALLVLLIGFSTCVTFLTS